MEVEAGRIKYQLVTLPKIMLSIRRSITTEEKNFFLILGQLYLGYAGFILSLKAVTITLWTSKREDSFPRLKTIYWSI